jgi:hypothetical protein
MSFTEVCITTSQDFGRGRGNFGRLARIESEFDRLSSFVRGGFPSPFHNRGLRGFGQEWMSTFYLQGLYVAVGRNQGFQLHCPSHIHSTGQFRICGDDPVHDFTFAFGLFLLGN